MRSAASADHWRRITSERRGFGLERVRITGKAPLVGVDVELPNGIAVLCGLNGVGKSTFLRLIEGMINGRSSLEGRCRTNVLEVGVAEAKLIVTGAKTTLSLGVESASQTTRAVVLDAFESCTRITSLGQEPNFHDLVDGIESRLWSDDERALGAYVLGRDYDWIAVYELEGPTPLEEGFGDVTLPFFRVSSHGIEYDSFAMGMGELAAFMALWKLWTAEPRTIVILEEPETFLSSRSAVALLDVLARQVDRKHLYGVVTTHSPDVVARVPMGNVILLQRAIEGAEVVLRRPGSRAELEYALGGLVGQVRLILTEDKTARMLTREVLARLLGIWGQSAEVKEVGDASIVLALCKTLPESDRLRVVGILDGDQRGTDLSGTRWPVVMLPGSQSPNIQLQAEALRHPSQFAANLNRPTEILAAALGAVAGSDSHDWFPDLAARLNVEESAVVQAAIGCWLTSETGLEAADSFVADLTAALGT